MEVCIERFEQIDGAVKRNFTTTLVSEMVWTDTTVFIDVLWATDNYSKPTAFTSQAEFEAWKQSYKEQRIETAPQYSNDATAKHYQGYFEIPKEGLSLQWIDAIRHTGRFKDPAVFEACIELLVRNYLDRLGRKDDKLQELKKSRWYLDYWIQLVESGQL
jgi:hypothetical protein